MQKAPRPKFKYVAFATKSVCFGGKVKCEVRKGDTVTALQFSKLPESSQDCFWPVGMCTLIDEIQKPSAGDRPPVDYSKYSNVIPNWWVK
jgi:hypothetical protein